MEKDLLIGLLTRFVLLTVWSLLHFLDPLVFHEKTMLPFKTSFDLSAGNYDQKFLHKSQRFLELVMLRRTKEGVSSQITVPPREEITLYVPLSPAQKFWTKALLARTEATVLAEIFSDFEGQAANKKGKLNGVKSEGSGLKAEEGVLDLTDDGEHQVRANVQRVIEESKQKSQQFGGNDWKKMMNLYVQPSIRRALSRSHDPDLSRVVAALCNSARCAIIRTSSPAQNRNLSKSQNTSSRHPPNSSSWTSYSQVSFRKEKKS